MPSYLERIDTHGVTRYFLAVVLALVCVLPVASQDNGQELSPEAELAAAIILPDNPNREQTQAYIAEVVQLTKRLRDRGLDYTRLQEFMSSIRKFDAVPDQHIDLLITNLNQWIVKADIADSIGRRDPKVIKPIILAGLDEHPNNIIAIRYFGWYEDAREPIMRKFKELESLYAVPMDNAWLHAFTHLAQPKHYPKIKQLFVSSSRRSQQVLMLETMPGYDILGTIRDCVAATEKDIADGENTRDYLSQHHRELERLLVIAARSGDVDSLGKLIDRLNDPQHTAPFRCYLLGDIDQLRDNVTQFITFKGSNKEIAEWFKANRTKLVFDSFKKRFVITDEF